MTEHQLRNRIQAGANALFYVFAAVFMTWLLVYYLTGRGGPTMLAVSLVPVTFVIFTLDALRTNRLYPSLPPILEALLAAVYIVLSLAIAVYMFVEIEEIGMARAGFWNVPDMVMGGAMALLVMEYARTRYMALFVLNILLILYAVYGTYVPGLFNHGGISWTRIVSAMSVEMSTGVFSNLPQLALTLIGSFVLVLSALRAFGCVDSILKGASQIAVRSPTALPQAAVIGSLGVAAVSGSGAANAITTGSATIPAMIGAGMTRTHAAAIEAASSLGGQLMPPIMGISAFLMAEFLGRSYFDVVARGYAPAVVYFIAIATSVYLISVRNRIQPRPLDEGPMRWTDWTNLLAFLVVIGGLILCMAIWHLPPMFAALYVFAAVTSFLLLRLVVAAWRAPDVSVWRVLRDTTQRFVDVFAGMTAELTLLLATLSILTGAMVITGVPTKVGALLVDAAGVSLVLMGVVAFLFGALLGMGLPPAPTYILTALVIVPPMIRMGMDPWAVHFFAFFLAVWGELTPPTSVVAAVTSKIADAPFIRTLVQAILICSSLFVLMVATFTRPELVLEPGLEQMKALVLVAVAAASLCFALQAPFSEHRAVDLTLRLAMFALGALVLVHPSRTVAWLACAPAAAMMLWWLLLRRRHLGLETRAPESSEGVYQST